MVTPSSLTKSRISRRTTTTLRKHAVSVEPKSVEAFFPSQKLCKKSHTSKTHPPSSQASVAIPAATCRSQLPHTSRPRVGPFAHQPHRYAPRATGSSSRMRVFLHRSHNQSSPASHYSSARCDYRYPPPPSPCRCPSNTEPRASYRRASSTTTTSRLPLIPRRYAHPPFGCS